MPDELSFPGVPALIYIDDGQQVCIRMFNVPFLVCSLGIRHSLASRPGPLLGFPL